MNKSKKVDGFANLARSQILLKNAKEATKEDERHCN